MKFFVTLYFKTMEKRNKNSYQMQKVKSKYFYLDYTELIASIF